MRGRVPTMEEIRRNRQFRREFLMDSKKYTSVRDLARRYYINEENARFLLNESRKLLWEEYRQYSPNNLNKLSQMYGMKKKDIEYFVDEYNKEKQRKEKASENDDPEICNPEEDLSKHDDYVLEDENGQISMNFEDNDNEEGNVTEPEIFDGRSPEENIDDNVPEPQDTESPIDDFAPVEKEEQETIADDKKKRKVNVASDDESCIRMYEMSKHTDIFTLAKQFGVSTHTIRRRIAKGAELLKEKELQENREKWVDRKNEISSYYELDEMINKAMTQKEISEITGLSVATIQRRVKVLEVIKDKDNHNSYLDIRNFYYDNKNDINSVKKNYGESINIAGRKCKTCNYNILIICDAMNMLYPFSVKTIDNHMEQDSLSGGSDLENPNSDIYDNNDCTDNVSLSLGSIDDEIDRVKAEIEKLTLKLKDLQEQKRKTEAASIFEAYINSGKSFDEIMMIIKS